MNTFKEFVEEELNSFLLSMCKYEVGAKSFKTRAKQ
jgi:hypothetical protein